MKDSIRIERSSVARMEAGVGDQPAEPAEVGIGGEQKIDAAPRLQPLARLREERRDVAVAWAGVPGAIGDVARLAGEGGRARQDHVEERARGDAGEEIRADREDPVRKTVRAAHCRRRKAPRSD